MASPGKPKTPVPGNQLIGEPDRRRILVVEDEPALREMLARFLRSRGYIVHTAGDGGTALRELRSQQYALLLSDVLLPDAYGVELVDSALAHDADLAVILLTGFPDAAAMNAAYEHGAMDYLTKPVSNELLDQAIERALAQRTLARERRQLESFIEREVAKETAAFNRERDSRTSAIAETLSRVCALYEDSFGFLAGMSARVATVATVIGQEIGLNGVAVDDIRTAAGVRDIGLISVPAELLRRPGPLGADEFNRIKQHVRVGVELLAPLGFHPEVVDFVHSHHEHWDGSGYPRRLGGDSIPLGGRILCTAETFVALISPRPFRQAMTSSAALEYLSDYSGGLLDPNVYEALVRAVRESHILGLET
ncbi:MAG TPA: HD domain-containing phosphohydrolase [Gemmatimonadaceae bacterium]|nr:HD domain-containing phosphohydrolase [Gemmatimonadaceae bacterium]